MSDRFVDPIVSEIHAIRAEMLASVAGDVAALMKQVAVRQQESGRQIIREPLRVRGERPHMPKKDNVSPDE